MKSALRVENRSKPLRLAGPEKEKPDLIGVLASGC